MQKGNLEIFNLWALWAKGFGLQRLSQNKSFSHSDNKLKYPYTQHEYRINSRTISVR